MFKRVCLPSFAVLAVAVAPVAANAQAQTPPRAQAGTVTQQPAKAKPQPRLVSPRKTGRRVVTARPNARRMAERAGYKRVSSLVNFPSFFPGIGVVYVKPDTLPNGPFLAFDRSDRLSSTIYMIPVEDIENRKKFDFAKMTARGDHVTLYFNRATPESTCRTTTSTSGTWTRKARRASPSNARDARPTAGFEWPLLHRERPSLVWREFYAPSRSVARAARAHSCARRSWPPGP
jgi:hypothetical protein